MDSVTLDGLIAWIGTHSIAAGTVIFAIAFCDALVILGLAVPALPLLFGVGTLVGLGHVDGTYAIVSAALGAFCGDGVSYAVGWYFGARLKQVWPFSRHPDWLESGERFFRRHGLKGIFIARFVGAVRPFVPAIAGMLRMRPRRYAPASLSASVGWALLFIVPGWLFGASLELLTAIAGRLAIVLGLLVLLLATIYLLTNSIYRVLAPRAAFLLERSLAWSHRHLLIGRFSAALIDPNKPESASLLLLAILLAAAGWGLFSLLIVMAGHGEPLSLDLSVHQALFSLRTPLADHLMAMLAGLGDWQVLGAGAAAVFLWLWWRNRPTAAWHWVAAIGFGPVLVAVLGFLLHMPKPPAALLTPGFSFPSAQVTMSTVVYGFFAVLIARELPGRKRAWPYVLAGLLVALVAFARLYLGAHWLSDVLGGALLGLVWIAGLGLAYRRRVTRSFWVRPIATLFFAVIGVAGIWHGARNAAPVLSQFDPPLITHTLSADAWRHGEWSELPTTRNQRVTGGWPMNLQYAGSLSVLRKRLRSAGWVMEPKTGWNSLLRTLDKQVIPATLPVLPASHNGRAEVLLMTRTGTNPDTRFVLRLWISPLVLAPDVPVWQGSVSEVRFERRLGLFSFWRMDGGFDAAREALFQQVADFNARLVRRAGNGIPVLLLQQPGMHLPSA